MKAMGQAPMISGPPLGVGLHFDVSMWPLVVVTMPPVTAKADFDYLRRCYEDVFAQPNKHALVVDTTTIVRVPGATLRRQMKEFEDSRRPIIHQKNIGSAIVIQNPLVRGAYTALRWISPQPAPNKAFASVQDGARWCIDGIEADGQTAPVAAYAYAGLAREAAAS